MPCQICLFVWSWLKNQAQQIAQGSLLYMATNMASINICAAVGSNLVLIASSMKLPSLQVRQFSHAPRNK